MLISSQQLSPKDPGGKAGAVQISPIIPHSLNQCSGATVIVSVRTEDAVPCASATFVSVATASHIHARISTLSHRCTGYSPRAIGCKLQRSLQHPLPLCPTCGTEPGWAWAELKAQSSKWCWLSSRSVVCVHGGYRHHRHARAIHCSVQELSCMDVCPTSHEGLEVGSMAWSR